MNEVHKPVTSQCYTLSSEPFGIYGGHTSAAGVFVIISAEAVLLETVCCPRKWSTGSDWSKRLEIFCSLYFVVCKSKVLTIAKAVADQKLEAPAATNFLQFA
jgi:hypothetical protein